MKKNIFPSSNGILKCIFSLLIFLFSHTIALTQSVENTNLEKIKADWDKAVKDYAEGRHQEAMIGFMLFSASGFIEASHNMGVIYEEGKAVPRSMVMAMKYFECAANAGYPQSQLRVSYHLTSTPEVKQDKERAYFWASLAAANPKATDGLRQLAIEIRNSSAKSIDQPRHLLLDKDLRNWVAKDKVCRINSLSKD